MIIIALILLVTTLAGFYLYWKEYTANEQNIQTIGNVKSIYPIALLCLVHSAGAKNAARDYIEALFMYLEGDALKKAVNGLAKEQKWGRDFNFSNVKADRNRLTIDLEKSLLKFAQAMPYNPELEY